MSAEFGSNLEHATIRPSIADLTDVKFLQELKAEANQLRDSKNSIHQNLNALPSIHSIHEQTGISKPKTKKSRFAQQRQVEELKKSQHLNHDLNVPTGRFDLDLDSEGADNPDLDQKFESGNQLKAPLISEITERYGESLNSPNNSKLSSSINLGNANHISTQTSIPPWESRRLSDRHKNQKCSTDSTERNHSDVSPSKPNTRALSSNDKQQISSENESLMASMSQDEILQEQAALKAHLMQSNPELLTKLLTKLNVKSQANDLPLQPSSADVSTLKGTKHVHYSDESDKVPLPFQVEGSSLWPSQDNKVSLSARDFLDLHLTFDWNGVRVVDRENAHTSVDHQTDDSIHIHQSSTFTFQQLLQLILSSVPAQRIMGFKALNKTIVRYIGTSNNDLDFSEKNLVHQEFKDVAFDILIVASQAIRDRNLGIATSALILIETIFSKARLAQDMKSTRNDSIIQLTWIEHVLTETALLSDFHSQFQHQDLPRPSMVSIVRILCDMVTLGESSKVSEEILKRSGFLELIIQVLVAVPWPLNSQSRFEIPDLTTFELLLAVAKSSRACSRSMLDRGLLAPMLRFIALPYWNFVGDSNQVTQNSIQVPNDHTMRVLINSISLQFDLMAVYAGYGLGTSLRTSLDLILRSTTFELEKVLENIISCHKPSNVIIEQLNMISSYLKLLQSWMHCADDPHYIEPPHSINWSQVTEWESSILNFLILSSRPTSSSTPGVSKVFASACAVITFYLKVSSKKRLNISSCLATLYSLMPQLQSIVQTAERRLFQACQNENLKPDLSEAHSLISLAKLKTCLTRIRMENESLPFIKSQDLEYNISDNAFALGYRLAFEHEELSLLPWAISVLHQRCEKKCNLEKTLLAGLFIRNSVGVIVGEILSETFRICQSKIECEYLNFKEQDVQEKFSLKLSQLLPILMDYINYSGTSTQISEPTPHQIRNQVRQNDQAAFLLPSNWPLLILTCLKEEHLTARTSLSQIRRIHVARASYALAIVLQSSLNNIQTRFQSLGFIFPQLLLNRYMVWKSVMGSVIAINSQAYWPCYQGGNASEKIWSSIFEDPVCSQLILRLIKITPLYPAAKNKQNSETFKAEESELYAIFTDILAIYDLGSFEKNTNLMKILTPFLSMSRAREFRGILFNDHTDLLKHMSEVRLEDVINVDSSSDDGNNDNALKKYFHPIEDNTQILHKFAEFLSNHYATGLDSPGGSFLIRYLIHHVSCQCWNHNLDERIRIDLLKIILGRRKTPGASDQICQLVLSYDTLTSLSERIHCHAGNNRQRKQGEDVFDQKIKMQRSQWLHDAFSLKKDNSEQHQFYLDRLEDLGWGIVVSPKTRS